MLFKHTLTKLSLSMVAMTLMTTAGATPVENFGENLASLQRAFQQKSVHIVQFGDSHTAGDYFTEQLRKRLQEEIGVGGIGFVYPAKINGQRNARHDYRSQGWQVNNSRFQPQGEYSVGGITAIALQDNASLTLTSQNYSGQKQDARLLVKGEQGQIINISDTQGQRQVQLQRSGWQTLNSNMTLPATLNIPQHNQLAGIWLDNAQGGTVSAIGINGATQDFWQRWRSNLSQDLAGSQADLVILAYGTNEAFQSNTDNHSIAIQQAISQIRHALPQAAILVVNAPESLKSTEGSCGVRPNQLDVVQTQLRRTAQQNKTLFWDWQAAMGGQCSMKSWISKGLATKDGVHFTRTGYEQAADDLYTNLKITLNNATPLITSSQTPPSLTSQHAVDSTNGNVSPEPPTKNTLPESNPMNQGSGKICDSDGRCLNF